MNRIIFSEQQSFRQTVWIWMIIIPVAFGTSLLMLYGFYQQIVLGEPWGDKPMSDTLLTGFTIGVIIIEALTVWAISSLRVSIEITDDEFRYRFFEYLTKWKTFTRHDIVNYSIEKYSWWRGRGLGFRKEPFSKTVRMIIKPDYILTLNVKDGRTILMSTGNKEELERAMRKLLSNSENT